MSRVIPFRRLDPQRRLQLYEAAERKKFRSDAIFFVALFSGVALVVYTLMVLTLPASSGEKLWLAWLIFIVAFSKLLLANGLFFGLLAHDESVEAERAARQKRASTRGLAHLTGLLPPLPEIHKPKVRVVRGSSGTAADKPSPGNQPRPNPPRSARSRPRPDGPRA